MRIRLNKERKLYLLLWSAALIILLIMVVDGYILHAGQKRVSWIADDKDVRGSEIINDLLLSAGQLSIAEKNSFIQLYLKPDNQAYDINKAMETKQGIYKRILQRKVRNLNKNKGQGDFYISPVPK